MKCKILLINRRDPSRIVLWNGRARAVLTRVCTRDRIRSSRIRGILDQVGEKDGKGKTLAARGKKANACLPDTFSSRFRKRALVRNEPAIVALKSISSNNRDLSFRENCVRVV